MYRIVIADDHAQYRGVSVNSLSDFEIVGEAENGEQAYKLVLSKKPDLLILDLSLPILSGLSVIKKIRKTLTEQKILVLTFYENDEYFREALQNGVKGYCLKDEPRINLMNAINTVLLNGSYYSSVLNKKEVSIEDKDNISFNFLEGDAVTVVKERFSIQKTRIGCE
jgi:DNA-binding NarL/FixJ family response regulator